MSKNTRKAKAPRIALVGCGAIAEKLYLPAFTKNPAVAHNLVLIDKNYKRAREMAAKFGVPTSIEDYRDCIGEVDGAIIALPHHLHFDVSLCFLTAGAHVLCEKPLAETERQVRVMVQEAERHEVFLLVNNTRRLFPAFKRVRDLIREGKIGEPRSFHFEEGGRYNWPTTSGFYFSPRQSKGGVLMDTGAHVIDLVCWWFDSRPKVKACTDDSFGGCEAVVMLELQVGEAVYGSVKLSRLSRLNNKFVVKGEDATVSCEPYNWRMVQLTKDGQTNTIRLACKQRDFDCFGRMVVDNFIKVILGEEQPLVPGKDVVDSVSVLEECYRMRERFHMPWMEAWR